MEQPAIPKHVSFCQVNDIVSQMIATFIVMSVINSVATHIYCLYHEFANNLQFAKCAILHSFFLSLRPSQHWLKIAVIWSIVLCDQADIYWYFGEIYCPSLFSAPCNLCDHCSSNLRSHLSIICGEETGVMSSGMFHHVAWWKFTNITFLAFSVFLKMAALYSSKTLFNIYRI
jgi:hypothetical protein